ncbi:hypothetical protein ACFYYS_23845 [Streptomyces sp. NPDC002120]|uniref:hypothetical protein n=1 Tax=Streptomyces sp. NPDC002120 TaxID=3364631 RepID=UPI0036CAB72C
MPLDDDVNAALTPLHFGANSRLWGKAIQLQISRLKPIEDLALRTIGAFNAVKNGNATAEQLAFCNEFQPEGIEEPALEKIFLVMDHPNALVDAMLLVIAMRGLLSQAEQMILQTEPLGKAADLKRAVERFKNAQPWVAHFRNVIIHNDEYSVGRGIAQRKAINPNEGMGVTQDDDGRILAVWGGHSMLLLQAAEDALTLWRDLNSEYWGKLLAP